MKPSVKIIACTIILITLLALSCGSPQGNENPVINDDVGAENKLIGVWKAGELVETDLDIPETAKEVVPDWYMVFTKKYRFVLGSRIPNRQELPENPTDAQLVAAWESVVALALTYEVKGNTLIEHLLFAKNPIAENLNANLGEQGGSSFKFDGDDLLWTFSPNGGRNTATQRFTRLE